MTRAKSFDWWFTHYQPVDNIAAPVVCGPRVIEGDDQDQSQFFETYGADLDVVLQVANTNERHVWTLVDSFGEMGRKFGTIVPGYHLVNRMGYYITALPWADDSMEVKA